VSRDDNIWLAEFSDPIALGWYALLDAELILRNFFIKELLSNVLFPLETSRLFKIEFFVRIPTIYKHFYW
jgi:hypothetical protein